MRIGEERVVQYGKLVGGVIIVVLLFLIYKNTAS